jgi:glycosyltransferase involved in cell wall biosynthesis
MIATTPGVTLITPTGNRPEAFAMCQRYVARQTWRGALQWIVVDDGDPETEIESYNEHIEVTRVRPPWRWRPGQCTLAQNLLAAIPHIHYDHIVFFEDDDWYAADYVERMWKALEMVSITGEATSRYYHVTTRQWRVMENEARASLCQTAIHADMLPALRRACESCNAHVDVRLWEGTNREVGTGSLARGAPYVVGIKGMPGRPGAGIGHHPERGGDWAGDPDGSMLRSWIGADSDLYLCKK